MKLNKYNSIFFRFLSLYRAFCYL